MTLALLAFVLIYILGEADARRSGQRDPALGLKIATSMLVTVCFQVALLGLVILFTGFALKLGEFASKPAFGMILGAAIAGAVPLIIYVMRLRTGGYPVGRKAIGVNTIIAGVIFTLITIALMTTLVGGASVESFVAAWFFYGATTITGLLYLVPRNAEATHSF